MSDTYDINVNVRSNAKQVFGEVSQQAQASAQTISSIYRRNKGLYPGQFDENRRRSEEEYRKQIEKTGRAQKNANQDAIQSSGRLESALMGVAGRYLSVAAAIGFATRSFNKFSEETEALRVVQVRSGAVQADMDRLKDRVNALAKTYGVTNEQALAALETLRETGYLSATQVDQVADKLAQTARLFGVDMKTMAEGLGSFMNIFKLNGEQASTAIDMMTYASAKLNIHFEELNRYAPTLAGTMRDFGIQGTEGVNSVLAAFATLRKEGFGDTRRTAAQLMQTLNQLHSGAGIYAQLGMSAEEWGYGMERASKQGKGLEFALDMLAKAQRRNVPMFKMFGSVNDQRAADALLRKFNDLNQQIRDGKITDAERQRQLEALFNSPDMAAKKLIGSIGDLGKALASLAVQSGALGEMNSITTELNKLEATTKRIQEMYKKGKWEGTKELLRSLRLPKMGDLATGMLNGPTGGGDPLIGPPAPKTPTPTPPANGNTDFSGRKRTAADSFLMAAIPGSSVLSTIKEDAKPGPDQHELRSTLRYLAGIPDPKEPAPWQQRATSTDISGMRTATSIDLNTHDSLAVLIDIRDLLQRAELEGLGGGSGAAGGGEAGGGRRGLARRLGMDRGRGNEGYSATGDNPEFNAKVDQMIADAAKEGITIKRGGGFRTRAQQAALYAQKPGLAAPPGSSLHELGIARDLEFGPGGAAWAHRNAAKYGLRFPMSYEPWHVQPIEGRRFLGSPTGTPDTRGPAVVGRRGDPRGMVPFIRETAIKYGIDPDTAVRVAQSEGLEGFTSGIRGENSYGAFQLNTQGGLGNDFQRETGLDPSDPKNEKATIDYALRHASRYGWSKFHGARNRYGMGNFEGIGAGRTKGARAEGLKQQTTQTGDAVEDARKPIKIRAEMDYGSDAQFRRKTIRREVDRELREARYTSLADIGAA